VLINFVKNTAASKTFSFSQSPILFGLWFFSAYSSFALSDNCDSDRIDQYAIVSHVYDGDTVKLVNGTKIRLIGINTPEMNYKTGSPEPFAQKAKRFLRQQVLNKKIGLRFGSDKKDRYGRRLAHIFYNQRNIQQALLKRGLAAHITIPPNLWGLSCYESAEYEARRKKNGLWRSYHKRIINSEHIKPSQTGFQFVKGTIKEIRENRHAIWLKLSNKVSLRINKKDLRYFSELNIEQLIGKKVVARGWVNFRKKRFYLTIKHPIALGITKGHR